MKPLHALIGDTLVALDEIVQDKDLVIEDRLNAASQILEVYELICTVDTPWLPDEWFNDNAK